MGHYASEMGPSPQEETLQKLLERAESLQEKIRKLSLGVFCCEDLPAVMVIMQMGPMTYRYHSEQLEAAVSIVEDRLKAVSLLQKEESKP